MPRVFPSPKQRRPLARYVALGVLFLIAVTYETRYNKYAFPEWFGRTNAANWPFLVGVTNNDLSIAYLRPEAKAADLHEGDTLVAVNGKPVTGTAVFGRAIAHAHGGDVLEVTVRPKGNTTDSGNRAVSLKLSAEGRRLSGERELGGLDPLVKVLLALVMPLFCLLLGFWVAAVRPRDPLAWLLLALMLSFAAVPYPMSETWAPGLRDFGAIYHSALNTLLLVWMLLFGIYFPEPFPASPRWHWWNWCKWLFGAPLVIGAMGGVIFSVGQLESYADVARLGRILTLADKQLFTICAYGAVGTFFACLWAKSRMAISRDAKRRLRLLYAGALAAFTPLLILGAIAGYHGTPLEEYFPELLPVTAYLCAFLFPITLAYVIVVHKAMNVSVVIRQGLQYAVAKGGIRALRLSIGGTLGYMVYSLATHMGPGALTRYLVIGVGLAVLFGTRRLTEKLARWTDRRFFRDAYQAEHILAELSEKVRGIVETRSLLETISQRIAESLHVPQVAVLIDGSGPYRPAYAVGYNSTPDIVFAANGGTVQRLREEQEPARVYLDDPNSWVYRTPGVTEEERTKLEALRTELLLPLSVKDKLLGFISLSQKRSEEPYSGTDLRLLKSVAAQAGLALENSWLTSAIAEEVAQREKLNREIEIAREVQERLFPQKLPVVDGLDYCGKCRPALGVGGDYYDFLALPGGRLGIALGDVSGKGIAAALMMASLEASLRAEAMRGTDDLAALIQNVNRLVFDATAENRYATFFYAQYDPEPRELSYVNAGHNPPMLFRKRGTGWRIERLETGGTVVGLLPQFPYHQAAVALEAGDLLVIFTDGVSEAMNPADAEWGEERMIEAIQRNEGLSAAELIERVMQAADTFACDAKQHDDMTLVVLRVLPAA
jgi:sigma-B regulation protein RsbU (phosphoserine phosphatase)